jgi:hypothetical protein
MAMHVCIESRLFRMCFSQFQVGRKRVGDRAAEQGLQTGSLFGARLPQRRDIHALGQRSDTASVYAPSARSCSANAALA